MNRGNGWRVFHGEDDYGLFLEELARPVEAFRVSPRAFCLMPNQFGDQASWAVVTYPILDFG